METLNRWVKEGREVTRWIGGSGKVNVDRWVKEVVTLNRWPVDGREGGEVEWVGRGGQAGGTLNLWFRSHQTGGLRGQGGGCLPCEQGWRRALPRLSAPDPAVQAPTTAI